MRTEPFWIDEQRADHRVVIAVRGEVDIATVSELREALSRALDSPATDVWVDLSATAFIDSTALATLAGAHRALDGARRLSVICPAGPVRRVFEISGLDAHLALFPSRSAANGAR